MRRYISSVVPLSVLFVLLWSSGLVGSKYGLGYAGTLTLLMWRYLLVILTLVVLISAFKLWRPITRSEFLSHGLVGVLTHAVFLSTCLVAMDLGVSVGLAAFVLALQPMLTALLSRQLTGEKTTYRQCIGLGLGLFAVLLVVGDRLAIGGSVLAYSLLFLAPLSISIGTVINRRIELEAKKSSKPERPILLLLLIQCIGAMVFLFPLAGYIEGYQVNWTPSFVFAIAFLAWVVSLSAYGLFLLLLRKLTATKVSCLVYLSPPTTMMIAFFAFGERLAAIDLIGLAIAAVAVWIVSKPELELEVPQKVTNQTPRLHVERGA